MPPPDSYSPADAPTDRLLGFPVSDDMFDPYARFHTTYDAPAAEIFLITPNDDAMLSRGVKRIRVFNSLDTIAMLTLQTAKGSPVSLAVPPQAIIWEDIRVVQVYETGTEETLVIHGYTD